MTLSSQAFNEHVHQEKVVKDIIVLHFSHFVLQQVLIRFYSNVAFILAYVSNL